MNFVQRFTFLFSAPTFEAEDLEGLRVAEIITAIQRMGFQVIRQAFLCPPPGWTRVATDPTDLF